MLEWQPRSVRSDIFYRPGVAEPVLQTPLSLIYSFIDSLTPILLIFKISQTVRDRELTCHMTHFIFHVSHVRFQVSGITCQVSHITCNSQTVIARELKCWENFHLLPPVMCPMSLLTCYVSYVRYNMSNVTCHMSCVIYLFFYLKKKTREEEKLRKWWS